MTFPIALIFSLLPASLAAATERLSAPLSLPDGRGDLTVTISERTRQESRPIPADKSYWPADPRGQLIISFSSPDSAGTSPLIRRWETLTALLVEANSLLENRQAIVAQYVEASRAGGNANELKAAAKKFRRQFREFRDRVKVIVGDDAFQIIDANRAEEKKGFLENLCDWIRDERVRLHEETAAISDVSSSSVTVKISAFITPARGERRQVHVVGYDNIAAAIPGSIAQSGQGLTPQQASDIRQGYAMAQQASKLIGSIKQNQGGIRAEVALLKDHVGTSLEQVSKGIRPRLQASLEGLKESQAILRTIVARKDDLALKASALQSQLSETTYQVQELQAATTTMISLRDDIVESQRSFLAAFAGSAASLSGLMRQTSLMEKAVKPLPSQFKMVAKGLGDLIIATREAGEVELANQLTALSGQMGQELQRTEQALENQLPGIRALINESQALLGSARSDELAINSLTDGDVAAIKHDVDTLPDGKIDLRKIKATKGDVLDLTITAEQTRGGSVIASRSLDYNFDIHPIGIYLDYSAQLIFATPAQGLNKNSFETNAAVLANYRWGIENPKGYKKFLEWLDFGIGPHVASLNQGAATAETGVGLSVGICDNLVTAGYGWNLGVPGSPRYYFVGIGILELLQQFRTVRPPNSETR